VNDKAIEKSVCTKMNGSGKEHYNSYRSKVVSKEGKRFKERETQSAVEEEAT
jgi:hypothetical protein